MRFVSLLIPIMLILEHKKVPQNYYKHLIEKRRKEQGKLLVAISQLARVLLDRPASLSDIPAFEKALGVRMIVINGRLGNKFITSIDQCCRIYFYLVDDDHFHAVTNISGLLSANYFCQRCLKH